jgi:hypothetical protein
MDLLVAMGFMLCMLYLFYEREERRKPRTQTARSSRTYTGAKSKRPSKRRTK